MARCFVSWIFLLLVQKCAGRHAPRAVAHDTRHPRHNLPPLMVVFGLITLYDSIRRNGTGIPAELLLVGDTEELILFAGLTCWAMLARRNASAHKRLMILSTLALIGPAVNRWPFPSPSGSPVLSLFVSGYRC